MDSVLLLLFVPEYKQAALVFRGVFNFAVCEATWSHNMHNLFNYGFGVNALGFTFLARWRSHMCLSEAVIGCRQ